jgi:hypothetical protein
MQATIEVAIAFTLDILPLLRFPSLFLPFHGRDFLSLPYERSQVYIAKIVNGG